MISVLLERLKGYKMFQLNPWAKSVFFVERVPLCFQCSSFLMCVGGEQGMETFSQ